MKKLILTLTLNLALTLCAGALDFHATPQSAWVAYAGAPAPAHITDARLRSAMEWRVLGGPIPRISATPYGIRLALWDRTIRNFGLPIVAAEYNQFLHELRAELVQEEQTKGSQ